MQADQDPAPGVNRSATPTVSGKVLFIGYRVDSEKDLVERICDKLTIQGVQFWWDTKCLRPGIPWEEGFADGLNRATVFVPVLSKLALAAFSRLTPDSSCDNVLLEHQLALELKKRGDLRRICPILVGELEPHDQLGELYGDFFKGNGMPNSPDVVVKAVDEKLAEHLQRLGKGAPQLSAAERTVKATLKAITAHQGFFLSGVKSFAIESVVAGMVGMLGDVNLSPATVFEAVTSSRCVINHYCPLPRDDCSELISFLRSQGLTCLAEQFSQVTGMELKSQLRFLQEEDFDDPDFAFLKPCHKRQLIELVRDSTAHSLSPVFRDDSDLSVAATDSVAGDTDSESGDDAGDIVDTVVAKHPGNPEDFQEHMKGFITDLLEYMSLAAPDEASQVFTVPLSGHNHEWSYCMLVWMRFAKDAYFNRILREKWRECITFPSQDKLLAMLDSCLQQECTSHKWWARSEFKRLGCNKQFANAIFVTDMMVQQSLKGHAESGLAWQQDVVKSWFTNGEEASDFILRANTFLREHFANGCSVVTQVVQTQSYVALMRMTKLASLVLFEYLDVRKLQESSTPSAAGSIYLLLHGFLMFVSSSKHVFTLTEADAPAACAMPTVLRGLQCLSRLSAFAWEMLGPEQKAREMLGHDGWAMYATRDEITGASSSPASSRASTIQTMSTTSERSASRRVSFPETLHASIRETSTQQQAEPATQLRQDSGSRTRPRAATQSQFLPQPSVVPSLLPPSILQWSGQPGCHPIGPIGDGTQVHANCHRAVAAPAKVEVWRGMEQDVRKEWEEKATSAKDHYMVGFACVQPALSGRVGGCAVAVTAHAPARRTRKSCGWSSGKQCRRGRMASNDVVSPPSSLRRISFPLATSTTCFLGNKAKRVAKKRDGERSPLPSLFFATLRHHCQLMFASSIYP